MYPSVFFDVFVKEINLYAQNYTVCNIGLSEHTKKGFGRLFPSTGAKLILATSFFNATAAMICDYLHYKKKEKRLHENQNKS